MVEDMEPFLESPRKREVIWTDMDVQCHRNSLGYQDTRGHALLLIHTSHGSDAEEHDIPGSTYRKASEDIDDNVVSSVQFADFSVQVYSTDADGQDFYSTDADGQDTTKADYFFDKSYAKELKSPFSRASMMSSSPYKDGRNEEKIFIHEDSVTTPRETEANVIAHEGSSPVVFASSSFYKKDRKTLMTFDRVSDKRATLPGDKRTKIEPAQAEKSSTSFSLPRNVRISQTEETIQAISPQISPVLL